MRVRVSITTYLPILYHTSLSTQSHPEFYRCSPWTSVVVEPQLWVAFWVVVGPMVVFWVEVEPQLLIFVWLVGELLVVFWWWWSR